MGFVCRSSGGTQLKFRQFHFQIGWPNTNFSQRIAREQKQTANFFWNGCPALNGCKTLLAIERIASCVLGPRIGLYELT